MSKHNKHLKEALQEGAKESLRTFIFMSTPLIIVFAMAGINTQTGEININFQVLSSMLLFQVFGVILAGLDKAKHIYGKLENPDTKGESYGLLKI
jgi:hypothetical protein